MNSCRKRRSLPIKQSLSAPPHRSSFSAAAAVSRTAQYCTEVPFRQPQPLQARPQPLFPFPQLQTSIVSYVVGCGVEDYLVTVRLLFCEFKLSLAGGHYSYLLAAACEIQNTSSATAITIKTVAAAIRVRVRRKSLDCCRGQLPQLAERVPDGSHSSPRRVVN